MYVKSYMIYFYNAAYKSCVYNTVLYVSSSESGLLSTSCILETLIQMNVVSILWEKRVTNHLSGAGHGIFRNGVHLVLGLHLPALLLVLTNFHQHDAEVRAPQIQSQEIAHLCQKTYTTFER